MAHDFGRTYGEVRARLKDWLAQGGSPYLQVGRIASHDGRLVAVIEDVEGRPVLRVTIDPHSGQLIGWQ